MIPRRTRFAHVALALLLAVSFALAPGGTARAETGTWFKPGTPHTNLAPDPSVTRFGPMLMAYTTNQGGTDLPVMWSAEATTWTARVEYEGGAASQDGDQGYFNDAFPSVPWGINKDQCNAALTWCDPKELWAPSVGLIGTRWMAYHAVQVAPNGSYTPYGRFCIYASTSLTPMGPFSSASSQPLVCPSTSSDPGGAIDPDVVADESTGKNYLVWKTEGNSTGNYPAIWSAQLNGAGTGFASSPRKLLAATGSGWEGKVIENPSMVKFQGRWWLIYSGNEYVSTNYAVGYATCSGPLGPCSRGSGNPILRSGTGRYGTGGADAIVDERGRLIATYHAWTGASGSTGTGYRKMWVAQLSASSSTLRVSRAVADTGVDADVLWDYSTNLNHGNRTDQAKVGISGTYTPVTGDFDGDTKEEIFWYGAWGRGDAIWEGTATPGTFSKRNLAGGGQAGSFVPVPGDFNGDGRDDIFFYQPGGDPIVAGTCCNYEPNARPDQLWFGKADGGFTVVDRSQAGVFIPLAGDFNGDDITDILWYAPGADPDQLWLFTESGAPVAKPFTINGNYRPIVGDFGGDGFSDIFWYGPGAIPDSVWTFGANATYSSKSTVVNGDAYRPFAGNFDTDTADEMFFYGPGSVPDSVWTTVNANGSFVSRSTTVNGPFSPVTGDYDGNAITDVFWYR